jgi:hypothetical protein
MGMPSKVRRSLTWLVRGVAAVAVLYFAFFAAVATAMLQTPERFGLFMRHAPAPLVWGLLPAPRMWLWARKGRLQPGNPAPDFTLSTADRKSRVALSAHRGQRPVVLVFGSYT